MIASGRSFDDDQPVVEPPAGGDPVCWLARVCPVCGRFVEDARVDADSHCPSPVERTKPPTRGG